MIGWSHWQIDCKLLLILQWTECSEFFLRRRCQIELVAHCNCDEAIHIFMVVCRFTQCELRAAHFKRWILYWRVAEDDLFLLFPPGEQNHVNLTFLIVCQRGFDYTRCVLTKRGDCRKPKGISAFLARRTKALEIPHNSCAITFWNVQWLLDLTHSLIHLNNKRCNYESV